MTDRTANHPVIAGDGIAAAAMALALKRCGYETTIIGDGGNNPAGGVQLAPNGWTALKTLGIAEDLKSRALTSLRLVALESGITLATIRLEGRTYTGVARKTLRDALLTAAGPLPAAETEASITRIRSRITGIESTADSVTIALQNGETITAPWLIGCDGAPGTGAHGTSRAFVEAGGGRAPLHVRTALRCHIPAPATSIGGNSTTIWLDRETGGHIVHYPLHDNSINLVAVVKHNANNNTNAKDKALAMLTRQPLLAHFTDAIKSAHAIPLYDYAPLDTWQRGRVVLAGDAAHPMPPHLAQGAGQSLVDAAQFMRHVVRAGREASAPRAQKQNDDDLQSVFTQWSASRVREVREVTRHAKRARKIFGLDGIAGHARDMGFAAMGDAMLGKVLNEVWRG